MFNQITTSENLYYPMYKIHRCIDSPDTITEEERKRKEDIKLRNEQRDTKLYDCAQRGNLADLSVTYVEGYKDGYAAGYKDGNKDGRLAERDKGLTFDYNKGVWAKL